MNGFPIVVLAAALIAPGASPAGPSVQLVTFDDLQRRIGEPHLRLLDARPQGEYDKGHIPGAVRVDAKAVEQMAAKPGALADRAAWEAWIAPLGIGPDTEVLVYDANRQLDAARLWWLLRYLGVGQVGLIDGGFPLWELSFTHISLLTEVLTAINLAAILHNTVHLCELSTEPNENTITV